jgi:hypothetical protein
VAVDATLGIKKVHPLIATAAGQENEQKKQLSDNPNHSVQS